MKRRMRVITLAASKGGVGKTTLAMSLAVKAAEASKRVALLDLDPQESLLAWWGRRGKPKNPKLVQMDATSEAIELLMSEGWDWVFIDTSPAKLDLIEPGIAVADLVLIPTRPSALDVEQVNVTVELCRQFEKPFAFALNHAPTSWKLTKSTVEYLASAGGTVLSTVIPFRQAYMAAPIIGKSAAEVDKGGAAARDVDALWQEVSALAVKVT